MQIAGHISAMIPDSAAGDIELLQRHLREPTSDHFSQIVRRHIHWVYNLARRQLASPADAEDATQAVFILLLRKAHTFSGNRPLGPWMYKSAMLICRDMRKKRNRRAIHEQKAAAMRLSISHPPADSDLAVQLDAAIAHLRKSDQQIILLRFFQGLSHEQIAALLDISIEASKMRMSRAVEKLRQMLHMPDTVSALFIETALLSITLPAPDHLVHRVISSPLSATTHTIYSRALRIHLLTPAKIAMTVLALTGMCATIGEVAAHRAAPLVSTNSTTQATTKVAPPIQHGYFVGGNVRNPGVYPIGSAATLREIIALARGPAHPTNADTFALLLRRGAGQFDAYRYQPLTTPIPGTNVFPLDPPIHDGDFISLSGDKTNNAQFEQRFSGPIAPGDLLCIAIADLDQPGATVLLHRRVSPSGAITIPQLGSIQLSGQSMPQAEQTLRAAYIAANVIQSPLISVAKIEPAKSK